MNHARLHSLVFPPERRQSDERTITGDGFSSPNKLIRDPLQSIIIPRGLHGKTTQQPAHIAPEDIIHQRKQFVPHAVACMNRVRVALILAILQTARSDMFVNLPPRHIQQRTDHLQAPNRPGKRHHATCSGGRCTATEPMQHRLGLITRVMRGEKIATPMSPRYGAKELTPRFTGRRFNRFPPPLRPALYILRVNLHRHTEPLRQLAHKFLIRIRSPASQLVIQMHHHKPRPAGADEIIQQSDGITSAGHADQRSLRRRQFRFVRADLLQRRGRLPLKRSDLSRCLPHRSNCGAPRGFRCRRPRADTFRGLRRRAVRARCPIR